MPKEKLDINKVIILERKLAKFANFMDSIVRVPFTKQGFGADTVLSSIPIAGDIAALILTIYAIYQGRKIGLPYHRLKPAIGLAMADVAVGTIPVVGLLFDIFLRPSRKTLEIVHQYIREEYDIQNEYHVEKPFLHEALEKKQQQSNFWKNKWVSWLWLHIPDFLGCFLIIAMCYFCYWLFMYIQGLFL